MEHDKDATVLVTGASGFIATHIIQLLQTEGYRVRGTVRSLKNEQKVQPLKNLCPSARYPLELVEANLLKSDGWREAVEGCAFVFHVASPVPNVQPEHEEPAVDRASSLIEPAVGGTLRVLQACAAANGSVKRVVLTSSVNAVHGAVCMESGRVYTEEDWTDLNLPNLSAYTKSKTIAEKTAWEFVASLPPEKKFQLSVVNPCLVVGPVLYNSFVASLEYVKKLMDGAIPFVPRIHFGVCDVRDVALAHLRAMTVPEAAGHRHIVCSDHLSLQEIASVLRDKFEPQGYWIPSWPLPYPVLWLASRFSRAAKLALQFAGEKFIYSTQRMKDVLGIAPRDVKQSLVDTAYSLIEFGIVKKAKYYSPRI